jgi:hypothetical protein
MTPRLRPLVVLSLGSLLLSIGSCSNSSDTPAEATPVTPAPTTCKPLCFEPGDPKGHPDPAGARAAHQARAGRIDDAKLIRQPDDARQRVNVGDFLLANEKVALYIEDKGISDGYARFGGEILAFDQVGDDGLPRGLSRYGETLMALSTEMIDPDSVTVLQDGSDGKAAVVRVMGTLKATPFLGSLKALFPDNFGMPAIYDYILEPGAEHVTIRLGVHNTSSDVADFTRDEMHGFFHYSRNQLFTPEQGYGDQKGDASLVAFDSGPWNFAWRTPGRPLAFAIEVSGFQYFTGKGFTVGPGEVFFHDHVQLIGGGPDLDGLLTAVRRVDKDDSQREIKGTLVDAQGGAVPNAFVHVYGPDGRYLSRARTDAQGAFTAHAPHGAAKLVASRPGYAPDEGLTLGADDTTAKLTLQPNGQIHVAARDSVNGEPMPVRVQVIPTTPIADPPGERGEKPEINGRLYQEFAVTGDATLIVPPGEHRVIVSHGYEWDLVDSKVNVAAGQTTEVAATMVHSVDTTGVMCADFHIHSFFSADSTDPVEYKVRGALADGLDIPVSSEHEWVVDFQPIIEKLGMTKWAFGVPSEELTTFTWGHFGVLPLRPRADLPNLGAVDWIGKEAPEVFDLVHAQPDKPLLIINHPTSASSFSSYFSAALVDRKQGIGTKPGMWSDHFEAVEVFNDSSFDDNRTASVADWFSLLSHGKRPWAVGSSDSHHLRSSPVGYPRTCLSFGHDDPTRLSPELVRDAVATGNVVVSGGLYMTVTGEGESPVVGRDVTVEGGTLKLTARVSAASWVEATSLEVIVDGKTVSEVPLSMIAGGPGKRFENALSIPVDSGAHWVLLHAKGTGDLAPLHPGRKPFAVANPIFVTAK